MREMVMFSHLQLVNETLALEASEKMLPKKKQKEPTDIEIMRINQDISKFKRFVNTMRSSPLEYARSTGYHELFGLEPPEKEKPKSPEEVLEAGMAAARRTLASLAS